MISVCIGTYNGEKYIVDQIKSILPQLNEGDEIIISDDNSTDKTVPLIKGINDRRIKIFTNTGVNGVNSNFENALRHSKGDYIFLSDQDDVWLPGKVDECLKILNEYDCVVHDAIVVDENLHVISTSFFKDRNSGPGFWKNILKNSYLGCCMAFRRKILDISLPIPKTKAFYHDNWIGCLGDLKYKIKFIPFKGIYFRRHFSNTSSTAKKSNFSKKDQIINRFIQLNEVIKRLIEQHF